MYENPPITDIDEMCKAFSKDIPFNENTLFTTDELEIIGNLLAEYLNNYVKSKGGINKLNLYTEELDRADKEEIEELFQLIREYCRKN